MNIYRLLRISLLAFSAIAVTKSTLNAGAVGGPQSLDRLLAHDTADTITPIRFSGGQQAIIRIEEKASAQLLVSVYNPDGSLLRSFGVGAYSWRKFWFDPPETAYYKIVVTNLSDSQHGEYSLQTN
jgi:hypothetical protein